MGFLDFLRGYSPLEQKLLETYANVFAAMSGDTGEARKLAEGMLERARALAAEAGSLNQVNHGDELLSSARSDKELEKQFELKRGDGVTDDDIREWWNLSPIERNMMLQHDEITRATMYVSLRESGLDESAAGAEVWRFNPRYCIKPVASTEGQSRPLPVELHFRIDKWRASFATAGPDELEELKSRLESSPSQNAVIREEIRSGRI